MCVSTSNVTAINQTNTSNTTDNNSSVQGYDMSSDGRMHTYIARASLAYKLASTTLLRVRLRASCTGLQCTPPTWLSKSFTVVPGDMSAIAITGFPETGVAGQEILPRVILLDQFENVVSEASGEFLLISAPEVPQSMCFECSCPSDAAVPCAGCSDNVNHISECGYISEPNEGVAIMRTSLPTTVVSGVRMIFTAYVGNSIVPLASAFTDPFTVVPAAPATIRILQQPSDMLPGHTVFPFPSVVAQDRFGNTVSAGQAVTATVQGCCSAVTTVSKPMSKRSTSVNGTATFDDLLLHAGEDVGDVSEVVIVFDVGAASVTSIPFAVSRGVLNESNNSIVELLFEPIQSYEFGAVIAPAPRIRVFDVYSGLPVVGIPVKAEVMGCEVVTNISCVNTTTNSSDNSSDPNANSNNTNAAVCEPVVQVTYFRTSYCATPLMNLTAKDGVVVFDNLTAGVRHGIGPMQMCIVITAGDDATNSTRAFTVYNIAGMYVSVQPQPFFSAGRALSIDPEVVLCTGAVMPCPLSSVVLWWPKGITVSVDEYPTGGLNGGKEGLTRSVVDGKVLFSNMTVTQDIPLKPLRLKFSLEGSAVSVLSDEVNVLSLCSIFLTMIYKPDTVVAGSSFNITVGALNHLVVIDPTLRPTVNATIPESGANNVSYNSSVRLQGNTSTDAVRGIATLQNLKITSVGTYPIAVFAPGTSGSTPGVPHRLMFTVSVVNGPPAALSITRQPSGGAHQDPLGVQPTLQVLDAFGNVFLVQTGYTGANALSVVASTSSLPGGGIFGGATANVSSQG
jgi:hypothetical protein